MRKTILVVVALVLTAGGGYYYYGLSARQAGEPQIVEATLTQGDIVEAVQVTGTLQPIRTVEVGSQVAGTVSALYADFNSIVRKDQVIARVDPSLLQVQVDLQTAAVERQIGEIRNQETQLENAVAILARTRALFEKGLATREALEDAELQVAVRTTSVESAKKMLMSAEANLNQAKLNLGHTVIRSPIDGVVINRLVDVGQAVQSSVNVAQFFTLATDLRQLRLEAVVDEADVGRIRPGMPVEFTVDSYARETFRGTVDTVTLDARAQNNVVGFPVWIAVANPELKLRPSMTVIARIQVSAARDVTRLPSAATRFRPTAAMFTALGLPAPGARRLQTDAPAPAPASERAQSPAVSLGAATQIDQMFAAVPQRQSAGAVWVWDAVNRTLTEKPVRLGVSNGQQVQLLEGDLAPGQQVVTNIVLPSATAAATPASQSVFGSAGRGGPGGFGPGGFAPPPPGGFGRPGGGG